MGPQIAKTIGLGAACSSIFIGNLVLWIVGIGMILMSSEGRPNAIQNIRNYFGWMGAFIGNIVLGLTFLVWYSINLEYVVSALDAIFPKHFYLAHYFGIALGVLIAALSVGGIVLIRKVCVAAFAFILCLFFVSLFLFESVFVFDGFKFSLLGTVSVILVSFSGQVNLPTFFRHSRSKADSILALTLITVIVALFQFFAIISGFFLKFNGSVNFFDCDNFCFLFSFAYVVLITICANLNNIYFSSAVLEFFFPRAKRWWGYLSIGVLGSLIYALFASSKLLYSMENLIVLVILNLTIVLLMTFMCKMFVKYNPNLVEKFANNVCWFFGCFIGFAVSKSSALESYESFYSGLVAAILCFIFFLFIEKVTVSIRSL